MISSRLYALAASSCAITGAVTAKPETAMLANNAARIIEILGDFIVTLLIEMRAFTHFQICVY
jgi:hypothetical protein